MPENLKHSCAGVRLHGFRLPITVSARLVFYLQTSASPSSESGYCSRSCWITFCDASVQEECGRHSHHLQRGGNTHSEAVVLSLGNRRNVPLMLQGLHHSQSRRHNRRAAGGQDVCSDVVSLRSALAVILVNPRAELQFRGGCRLLHGLLCGGLRLMLVQLALWSSVVWLVICPCG